MSISIIIPVYNEEKTIASVIEHVYATDIGKKEIIVVNDGSIDGTKNAIEDCKKKYKNLIVIHHSKNLGKGSAVKSGIGKATGEYIIIQDADLEYNPEDIPNLLKPIKDKKAEVVYGTRLKRMPNFKRDERSFRFFSHYMGNKMLSFLTSVFYGQWVTDMETGYKVFPKKLVETMDLKARSFDFEPEITAKLMKRNYKIHEVSISTNPRNYKEGKKLHTIKDGCKALWTLVKYKFFE